MNNSKTMLSGDAREHLEDLLNQDFECAFDYSQDPEKFRSWLELNEEIRRWAGLAPSSSEELEEIVKEYTDRRS